MADNPSKKIRLDFQNKTDRAIGNEDLWGHDDITAEEFDFLEIQATQSCNKDENHKLQNKAFVAQNNDEVEDLKQLQYELEGRVKLLSHSLEKSAKELNEERLNREQLINERMKVFNEKEIHFQKEIERMQSILEFKEQEMKSTYSKLHMMKSQFKKTTSAETLVNTTFEDLENSKSRINGHSSKMNFAKKFHRKHKLVTDMPKGQLKGVDVLSSVLYSRFSLPSFCGTINNASLEQQSSSNFCTSASVIKFKNEQKCFELLEYYCSFLKSHIATLKSLKTKPNAASGNKSSPSFLKRREAACSQTVISYLQDIAFVFSCPQFNPFIEESSNFNNFESHSVNHTNCIGASKSKTQSSSSDSFIESDLNTNNVTAVSEILQLLSTLANPETYPSGYSKTEEIEFSLSALLTICSSSPEKFLNSNVELPVYSLINPLQNITTICATLRLLTVLSCCENFISYLNHKNRNCIFCLIADFLINIVPQYPENFAVSITLVEDFLSLIFSIPKFLESILETSECISEVIQGIIRVVKKYYQVREKIKLSSEIIKKGFLLLHFMSCCIPNFKERRKPVENDYISLVSSLLPFSKENVEFREFHDLIHNLWDFQTDITEFDLDDLSEEIQNSADDMDVVD